MKPRDYFAEMCVAGKLADQGWYLYFPHRDIGFDMIATKVVDGATVIRPIQVKGKYAKDEKTAKQSYGYIGKLTALHDDMVLAIPFFTSVSDAAPHFVAYMPRAFIKPHKKGYACQPAKFTTQGPVKRRDYERYFDNAGIDLLEQAAFGAEL